jgi:hypothetical protein
VITTLDVSNSPNLAWLECSGNLLVGLDLTNNTELDDLRIMNMPSLNSVCVFKIPHLLYTEGSPNVNISTDCSN